MKALQTPRTQTRIFARILGPFVLIVAITAATHSDMRAMLSEFGASAALPWVTGSFLLLAALSIVALHPFWRGPAAAIVSALGWLLVLRAAFLMAFPQAFMSAAKASIALTPLYVGVYVLFGLVGLYLTVVGWIPTPNSAAAQLDSVINDLPRAA